MPQTSIRRCHSVFDRDTLLSSNPSTIPTWFKLTSVINRWKPVRWSVNLPPWP